jgi:hypothetical protein
MIFGGGTFDISILRLSRGVFEVLATGGDSALGGDDFDAALAEWVLQQAKHCQVWIFLVVVSCLIIVAFCERKSCLRSLLCSLILVVGLALI